jgi:serine phosphatase RsbU (regulator of sigma subunit)
MSSQDDPTIVREITTNLSSLSIHDFQREKASGSALRIQREDRLRVILTVSQLLSSPEELEILLERIGDLIFDIMDNDRAVILLINEKTRELEPSIMRSRSAIQENKQIYSRNIVNYVVSRNVSVLCADAQLDPRFASAGSVVMQSIRSSLCVPLRARDKVIGAIYVDDLLASNRFGDEELEFLTAFANQAGLAIENSRLYNRIEDEARSREEHLQLLVHERTHSLFQEKEKAEAASLEAKKASEKLQKALVEAAEYVRSLLPDPLDEEIKADWTFLPSVYLGGDSFGYQWLDKNRFAIYLLDVCGHGIGAALLSITVMDTLNTLTLNDTDFASPASVLSSLNRTYPMEKHSGRFFTLWYGVYDKRYSLLTYASAGHPPAILMDSSSKQTLLQTRNVSIGLMPATIYTEQKVTVDKPSKLILFSDGVFENIKPDASIMNFDEFRQGIESLNWDATAEDITSFIGDVCVFPFEDDFSLVQLIFR